MSLRLFSGSSELRFRHAVFPWTDSGRIRFDVYHTFIELAVRNITIAQFRRHASDKDNISGRLAAPEKGAKPCFQTGRGGQTSLRFQLCFYTGRADLTASAARGKVRTPRRKVGIWVTFCCSYRTVGQFSFSFEQKILKRGHLGVSVTSVEGSGLDLERDFSCQAQ